MQKKIQVLADPVVVNFFEIHLIQHFFWERKKNHFKKKLQVWDQSTNYKCWIKCILKQFTTTGSANTCNFFCIFEKNYNDWIKSFSKSKWTGLTSHGLIREIPQKLMVAIKVFASVIINSGVLSAKV